MFKLVLSGLIALFLSLEAARIVQKTDHNLRFRIDQWTEDTVKAIGQTGYFSARVTKDGAVDENDDWKFCTWTRVNDGASCQFSYICEGFLCDIGSGDFHIESQCSTGLRDVTFYGEDPNYHNRICGIKVPSLGNEDDSLWNVTLQDCHAYGCGGDDGSDRYASHSTKIDILKTADPLLTSPTLGSPGQHITVPNRSNHTATCQVRGIRPQCEFTWKIRGGPFYGPISNIEMHVNSDGSWDMSQQALLTVDTTMNGANFECMVSVRNKTVGQEVIFSSSSYLTINVKPSSPAPLEIL